MFSIIIPTYNYAERLNLTLASLLKDQDAIDEIIIVNDGSTDHTPDIVKQWQALYPERRIIYAEQENRGPAAARQHGIRLSKADYLLFLDADDILLSHTLLPLSSFIAAHPDVACFICDYHVDNGKGKIKKHRIPALASTPEGKIKQYLEKKLPLQQGSVVFHRNVFERIKYPEDLRQCEDIPVFLQTLALFKIAHFPQAVVLIHKHHDSLRHHIPLDPDFAEKLTMLTFNSDLLPSSMMYYRVPFLAGRHLSLFRIYLNHQKPELALKAYFKAFRLRPLACLALPYLRKFLRALWQSFRQGKQP